MLNLYDRPYRLCDGVSRREWLKAGSLGLFGLSLPSLWQARAAQAAAWSSRDPADPTFGRAKNCIVLFLMGGPPQHETWDPKPNAPAEIRGEFQPIASATPGLHVGELMPRLATLTDKLAVIRSMHTGDNAHSSSGYWMLTGVPHAPLNSENATPGAPNNWPCVGAMVQQMRLGQREAALAAGHGIAPAILPDAIRLPEHIWNTGGISWPGQDAGFLGRTADPWLLHCDPNAADFQIPGVALPQEIPAARLDARRSLLTQVNGRLDDVARRLDAPAGPYDRWNNLSRQACDLMTSPAARRAFAIGEEPAAVRERYGRGRFGQSVLLARRLIEAGVTFVHVNWTRPTTDGDKNPVWDTHTDNAGRLKNDLMPPMDQAFSALLEDLSGRGLLDETLVVVMGEFGRSPKINPLGGRDHWGYVFSLALAGGGVRGGTVYGASDKIGGYPADRLTRPQDLSATMFHLLGIRPDTELRDPLDRPLPISRGEVLRAIL